MSAELEWDENGPRSRHYGDIYFSTTDGLAESRAVFLQGCGLPEAWAGRSRFTVAELGFGTGLNIAAVLDLWRRTHEPGAHLSLFSVEAHLITAADAERALGHWSEALGPVARALLDRWPTPRRGLHRLDLPSLNATLDLYQGEAVEALSRWSGMADAWFLDGFAPSRNPEMWGPELLAAVGRLSAPGARLASFTVAGSVRRGLAAAGISVEKRPGFGAKRERLEARKAGSPPPPPPAGRRAVVIGAGIAGAALARAYARQGFSCTVLEAQGAGAGASGNPAALVTPRFDAGFGPPAELHALAFARAVALYRSEVPQAVIAHGALQLGSGERDAGRFARLAAWDGFAPGQLRPTDGDALAEALDEAGTLGAAGLAMTDALVIEPSSLLASWLGDATIVQASVARIERRGEVWACLDQDGAVLAQGEGLAVATGEGAGRLLPELGATLRPVRGQVEFAPAPVFSGSAAAWGAYAIPTRGGGVLFGASHRRDEEGRDLRASESEANMEALAIRRPRLAARIRELDAGEMQARASVRAATADHLPLAGAAPSGVMVLGGLGGRGYTLAPLLAEHLAAVAAGAPSPLPTDLAARLAPLRRG